MTTWVEGTLLVLVLAILIIVSILLAWGRDDCCKKKSCKKKKTKCCSSSSSSSSESYGGYVDVINPITNTPSFNLNRVCPCNDGAIFAEMKLDRTSDTTIQMTVTSLAPTFTIGSISLALVGNQRELPTSSNGCLDPTLFTFQFSYPCPGSSVVSETLTIPAGIRRNLFISPRVILNDPSCLTSNAVLISLQGGRYPRNCASCDTSQPIPTCFPDTARFVRAVLPRL